MSRVPQSKIVLVGAECEENLALRYIRAVLEQAGHRVVQVDFNRREDIEESARAVVSSGASIAGFSMMFVHRAREFAALARRVRELKFTGHIVAGGHFAAFNADAILRDETAFDSVAIGEGEGIMLDLVANLGRPASVRGLVWRTGEGEVVHNPPAEKPADLDTIPLPVRKRPPDHALGIPMAGLIGSRGCSHSCAFCSVAAWHKLCGGPRVRMRSPAAIADEIAGLYEQGFRIIKFNDDNFIPRDGRKALERISELRRELAARQVGRIAFAIKSRPDSVNMELFGMLKEMGLFRVFVGIEAGTADSLEKLGRRQTVEENEKALEVLNALDQHVCFNIILFNPDSTVEDFLANVAFLRRHPVNPMNFCRAEVYPGTPLEETLRRAGRLEGNYWGHGYTISDPCAEDAFRLMNGCFSSRHHGQASPHVLAMKLDFETRLSSFFRSCRKGLPARTADFIRRLNLDTCDYLEEMGQRAARGFRSDTERNDYVASLVRRVENANAMFVREAEMLIEELHDAVETTRHGQGAVLTRAAAVFGMAASLSLADGIATQTNVNQNAGAGDGADGAEPATQVDATGVASIVRETVRCDLLPTIGRKLDNAEPVTVTISIGDGGAVTNCGYTIAAGAKTNVLTAAEIGSLGLRIPQCEPGEQRVRFSRKEVVPHLKPVLGEKESDPIMVQRRFQTDVLPFLAANMKPYQDVRIEIWVGADGTVNQAWVLPVRATNTVAAVSSISTSEVAGLISDLGSDKASGRDAASRKLAEMGSAVISVLKDELARNSDPEVVERCYNLVRDLNGGLPLASDSEIIAFIRSLRFDSPVVFGKRFVVPITKWQIERAGRIYEPQEDRHEMAPGPVN